MTQQGSENRRGTGLPIEVYVEDAQSLSPEEFGDRHGSAFLLVTAAGVGPPVGPAATMVGVLSLADEVSEITGSVSLVAFPVRRGSESVTHLVTVGRTSNNDIVISDISVSRFHAFLKQDANGTFQILDSGSTNGTRVNGAKVPTRGEGPPTNLKSGDTLRLGRVEFTFLDATALHSFALQHGH
ncbi:MAG: FHA domain-containing protein [Alphaproteobacteria bacterium]|nr:FHA domain-containing protein [Alphaproteobacteria bacterium]